MKRELRQLLLSDSRGIYIPRDFYKEYILELWNLKPDNYPALADPDNQFYWDDWCDLLDKAKHIDQNGDTWYLHQDGNLWAVNRSLLNDVEQIGNDLNLFGDDWTSYELELFHDACESKNIAADAAFQALDLIKSY